MKLKELVRVMSSLEKVVVSYTASELEVMQDEIISVNQLSHRPDLKSKEIQVMYVSKSDSMLHILCL